MTTKISLKQRNEHEYIYILKVLGGLGASFKKPPGVLSHPYLNCNNCSEKMSRIVRQTIDSGMPAWYNGARRRDGRPERLSAAETDEKYRRHYEEGDHSHRASFGADGIGTGHACGGGGKQHDQGRRLRQKTESVADLEPGHGRNHLSGGQGRGAGRFSLPENNQHKAGGSQRVSVCELPARAHLPDDLRCEMRGGRLRGQRVLLGACQLRRLQQHRRGHQ